MPFFACDNAKYIFGIEKLDLKGKSGTSDIVQILEDNGKDKIAVTKRSLECFKKSHEIHHTVLDGVHDSRVQAFLKFFDDWKPELSLSHPKIAEFKEEILAGGFLVFDLEGEYLHNIPVVRISWESFESSDDGTTPKKIAQCLVSGKVEPIARTHKWIKGVKDAQPAGASLIGFNNSAFESYNKVQGDNAPIGETAMFKYTTALNHLLERESRNRIQIGDATTVFWAETTEKSCEDLARFFIDPAGTQDTSEGDPVDGNARQDAGTRQLVGDILQKVKTGKYLDEKDLGGDPEKTKFFILGLSPNNARLAVRFWHEDSFGNFIKRVAHHHIDMEIVRDDRAPQYTSVYWLLKQTVPEGSKEPASSPLLGGLLMRSILEGTPYLLPMYSAILNRVKVERSINYARAGFIKAGLIRLARARKNNNEEMITVSLNEESQNVPSRKIVCGTGKDAERYEQGHEEHDQQQVLQQCLDNTGSCVPGVAETCPASHRQIGLGIKIESVDRGYSNWHR